NNPVTLVATDVDGDSLTYFVVVGSGPQHGTLGGIAPSLTYTPTAGYSGSDSFSYKARDASLDSNVAQVTIIVTATPNQAPTATDRSFTTAEDTPTSATLLATHP